MSRRSAARLADPAGEWEAYAASIRSGASAWRRRWRLRSPSSSARTRRSVTGACLAVDGARPGASPTRRRPRSPGRSRSEDGRAAGRDVARDAGSRSRRRRGSSATPRKSPCVRAHVSGCSTARLDYRPHAAAWRLRRAETGAIGLVIPSLATPVYARSGAFRRVERDFVVLLAQDVVARDGRVFARLVRSGRIDGLVVASARPGHPLFRSVRAACDRPRLRQPRGARQRAQHRHGRLEARAPPRSGTWWSSATSGSATLRGRRRSIRPGGARGVRTHARRLGAASAPEAEGDFTESGGADAAQRLLAENPG